MNTTERWHLRGKQRNFTGQIRKGSSKSSMKNRIPFNFVGGVLTVSNCDEVTRGRIDRSLRFQIDCVREGTKEFEEALRAGTIAAADHGAKGRPSAAKAPDPEKADSGEASGEAEATGELRPVLDPNGDGSAEAVKSAVEKALQSLNPRNGEHWTTAGKPRLSVVQDLCPGLRVTAALVAEVRPGFSRESAQFLSDLEGKQE